jgi:phage terminase small subunit
MALTAKQKLFVQEYLIDLNATRSYKTAGYVAKGNAAEVNASRLLSNAKVQAAIQEAMDKRATRTEITADRVLQELAKIGFANMSDYTTWGPKGVALKDSSTLTPDQAAAVSEVSETITEAGGSIRFKLHDKISALEKIGKHLGMFKEKVELTGDEGGPLQVVFSSKIRKSE